jgi:hypothetical protein
MSATMPVALVGASAAARRTAEDRLARALLGTLRPANPIRPALVLAAGAAVNGTPTAVIRWHGAARVASYPCPRPLRIGRLVFAQEVGDGDRQLVIIATNFQVEPIAVDTWGGGLDTGTGPGQSGSATPVVDPSGNSGFGDEPWGGG